MVYQPQKLLNSLILSINLKTRGQLSPSIIQGSDTADQSSFFCRRLDAIATRIIMNKTDPLGSYQKTDAIRITIAVTATADPMPAPAAAFRRFFFLASSS